MSMASAAAGVMEPQTVTYQRVPSNLPNVGIWLPTTKSDASSAGKKELQSAADGETPASFLKRVRLNVTAASRRAMPTMRRPKVSAVSTLEKSAKNSDVKLTELEKQYLEYLRRAIGTGQFSHYLMPA